MNDSLIGYCCDDESIANIVAFRCGVGGSGTNRQGVVIYRISTRRCAVSTLGFSDDFASCARKRAKISVSDDLFSGGVV